MNQLAKAKGAVSRVRVRPMSREVAEVRQNINMIQEAMKATMKNDVHFGVIPGCKKPSLYKAGAEILIALFKLAFTPSVECKSSNGEIRYLVTMKLDTRDGVYVGSGIGECSSGEEKYSWRAAICDKEFEITPETRRRIKFKKKYQSQDVDEIQQVRVNPSDMANTILKMAKKRALIDAVLTATGASDIFTQDIQDLPEGYLHPEVVQEEVTEAPQEAPQEEPKPPIVDETKPRQVAVNPISEPQRKRLFAIAMGSGMEKSEFSEWLLNKFNYSSSKDISREQYDQICEAAAAK